MKELKPINDKLFYSIAVRKDKFKNPVSVTLTIASANSFTGFITVKLTRQLKFARTVKKSNLEEKYRDSNFVRIMEDIRDVNDIEDMVLYLISLGFYDILKRIDFLTDIVNKYKLLRE